MTDRVLRYEVPVDDQWHKISATRPLHIGCRNPEIVEFWALALGGYYVREYRVFGTGHPIEEPDATYVGTTYAGAMTEIVWHLFGREVKK